MRRTEQLQGLRIMKFEEIYEQLRERRLSQSEAALILGKILDDSYGLTNIFYFHMVISNLSIFCTSHMVDLHRIEL